MNVAEVFRQESGQAVATLIRVLGDIDAAEDAVQDAFAIALSKWPVEGLPPNPGGWITTTARNRAIDRLRRDKRGRQLLDELAPPAAATERIGEVEAVSDDRLRLMFTCCHPALATEAQVALTLRLLGGLATADVAQSFLVAESTMAQRLVRAKRKIKAANIPYRVPAETELGARLPPVLAVLYLIFSTGSDRPAAEGPTGDELCNEAVRLTRLLLELMPHAAEVAGLLALLLLALSRRPARFGRDGSLVLLKDQDRGLWDRARIGEGQSIVRACLQRNRPGPYQLQAAIQAVHADAQTFEATDWRQILALYDQLLLAAPTPVVALNHAIALGEVHGPEAALRRVDALDSAHLDGYHAFHATRADLLRRLGMAEQAREAYCRAAAVAPTAAQREFLAARGRETR